MNHEDLNALEAELMKEPDSYELREQLLSAYVGHQAYGDPRRAGHILWFIRNHPADIVCRTPYVYVSPVDSPEVYAVVKEAWQDNLAAHPTNVDIVRGAALFLSSGEPEESRRLLSDAVERHPNDAALRVELGRISTEPAERLSHFQTARSLDGEAGAPNLLVWIADAATHAADYVTAESTARELLDSVAAAWAEYGDKLDWLEDGASLWTKARGASTSDEAARDLVSAIAEHAYRKHWAHTVLGLVAHARGDIDAAARHLRDSAELHPDFRLSAYGPSIELARALCTEGRWGDAAAYFERWLQVWPDARAERWKAQVNRQELPDLPGS